MRPQNINKFYFVASNVVPCTIEIIENNQYRYAFLILYRFYGFSCTQTNTQPNTLCVYIDKYNSTLYIYPLYIYIIYAKFDFA